MPKLMMWVAAFRRQVNRDMREGQVRNYHFVILVLLVLAMWFYNAIFEFMYNLF